MSGLISPRIPEAEPLEIEPRERTEAEITRDTEENVRRRAILLRSRRRGTDTLSFDPLGGGDDELRI